mmetsp:Transcript_23214/g.74591  ORF Transcript_23214/g.74591 Transcript_23214/m.74591 type:complete len:284 (+) Transcript_23214:1-852(+)
MVSTTKAVVPQPPPPPRSKKPKRPSTEASPGAYDEEGSYYHSEADFYSPTSRAGSILDVEPETTIGETLQISGKLRFERLLRLEGKFEGELISTGGDLVVGPRGEVVGDVLKMNEVVVYGKVIGKLDVDRLELCGTASIYGDITCKTLHMDPTVVLVGRLNVNPYAPQLIRKDGSIVIDPNNGDDDHEGADVEDAIAGAAANDDHNDQQTTQQKKKTPTTTNKEEDPPASPPPQNKEKVAVADGVGEVPFEEPTPSDDAPPPAEGEKDTSPATPPSEDPPPDA